MTTQLAVTSFSVCLDWCPLANQMERLHFVMYCVLPATIRYNSFLLILDSRVFRFRLYFSVSLVNQTPKSSHIILFEIGLP